MSEYFEIAYAAASGKLCLFTGTGFSKAVTENEAPSWQGLLESICDLTPEPKALKTALFPVDEKNALSLEEAAQVIAIELTKVNKSIHEEIAAKIRALTPKGDNSAIKDFLSKNAFKVITTNYDKLIEDLSNEADCHSLTPGLPIPRSQSRVKIYHVHGSIDSCENMVVTSDDYFRFINSETYFSRKLSTVLHENTVVIIGYSLGDTNLKAIISDYKGFSRSHLIGSNIFLISRSKINQHIKDYYAHCYGIRVLDKTEVYNFFEFLNDALPKAEQRFSRSIENIRKVILEDKQFKKDYLKIENSFFEIISSLAAIGVSINDHRVVRALGDIIKTKIDLTKENGAWVQYEHLARWLVYLASIFELKGSSIEKIYLDATCRSMTSMRKELYLGYSWHAYKSWSTRWPGIIASNRSLIRKHIEANTTWPDALAVVKSA
ncbi:hypothetical protein C8245_08250 [Paracidovorax avenae]|uniref:SIR2 family NAD-dependent protein deacylase n=1 Tax=Paracidovorax avenae TaxID=80867 RepID=UPI000D204EF3|nr:SIR2 family protein [Paracidovorax avenae]AVS65676.1 hypothetical protein C8245_08250 [Paracidovorax avenae]